MHLIVCVDERYGISFCGRRLSQDRLLNQHLKNLTSGHKLWMNAYSGKIFADSSICIHENFLEKAEAGEYCFLENSPLPKTNENLESVILYHWNRTYPSTVRFPSNLLNGFQLVETEDFPGNSHEKITMQRYAL